MSDVRLLKLGGSLLTDKGAVERPREETIRRLAEELAVECRREPGSLIVGHGSGSFGHAEAKRRGLEGGRSTAVPPAAVAAVQAAARRLHLLVMDGLLAAGAPALSFPPSACLLAGDASVGSWDPGPLRAALKLGALPVVYGDVVLDSSGMARICSTEEALGALARSLRADGCRIVSAFWLGETDGVLDARGLRIPEIAADGGEVPESVGGARGTDVTGGMAHRVSSALAMAAEGTPSWIGDGRAPGVVADALRGAPPGGTWIRTIPGSRPAPEA
ncbi:MAG: isopentenyl phosphate kinase [Gemmatimonadota bacterium]